MSALDCSFLFKHTYITILFSFLTCITELSPQTNPSFIPKKGGLCFRVDDNQSIPDLSNFAAIFNRYNQHFCFALNLDNINTGYANGIRNLQSMGHEMMDHTPSHETSHFTTILSKDCYINHPGVQRVKSSGLIELKYAPVDIACAKRQGYADIYNDTLRCSDGAFANFTNDDDFLYFPALDQLVVFNPTTQRIDQNTLEINDPWFNSIDLGIKKNLKYYNFDLYNVHLTIDAIKALIGETIRLADYYNLQRPITWIQPGVFSPFLHRDEIKEASAQWNFVSASGYQPNLKTFNEYNPNDDKQYGMNWGDINGELDDIRWCKMVVADRVAKHCVSIVSSHFSNLTGGWSGYLNRTEQLIQWCLANNIPIKTYSEWADILYNQIPDPSENIFPPLNSDLDGNTYPDGYERTCLGILKKDDGAPAINNYCYTISRTGQICSILGLGGIEKGKNNFEIWTKGSPGDFIEVNFKAGSQNFKYKFPAESAEWTKYSLEASINGNTVLIIPNDVSVIDVTISCSNYVSGTVKISGMTFTKNDPFPVELSSFTASPEGNNVLLRWQTTTEINNYGFDIERKISQTENWQKIGFVLGSGNSNSPKDYSFLDKNPLNASELIYRLKQIDNDGKVHYSNEIKSKLIIDQFILFQNYPNPFNSATLIKYDIPVPCTISIYIYNSIGEQIEVFNEGSKPAGKYNISWEPGNLCSGVYFCLLDVVSSDGKNHTRKSVKMILMK